MTCPRCALETRPGVMFCSHCDVLVGNPAVGEKATVAKRAGAHLFDGAFFFFLDFFVLELIAGGTLGAVLYYVAFFGIMIHFWLRGQTPGKALFDLQVIRRKSREVPSLLRMFGRDMVGKLLSLFALGLGYLWALWNEDNKTWHDMMVDTLVVDTSPSAR